MREEAELDAVWRLLDRGRPEDALVVLREAGLASLGARVAEVSAWLDLGQPAEAEAALEGALAAGLERGGFDHRWLRSQLLTQSWRIDEAWDELSALAAEEDVPEVLERLSFLAELRGDEEAGREYYRRAQELEPGLYPDIPTLADEDFDGVLEAAILRLPEVYREALEDAELQVAPFPDAGLVSSGREWETPPDLLGLFSGVNRLERTEGTLSEPTPIIYLFQRNLERACGDVEELREETRTTLLHELGHLLGYEEEGLEDLGLA